jgi:hypothetical protein
MWEQEKLKACQPQWARPEKMLKNDTREASRLPKRSEGVHALSGNRHKPKNRGTFQPA